MSSWGPCSTPAHELAVNSLTNGDAIAVWYLPLRGCRLQVRCRTHALMLARLWWDVSSMKTRRAARMRSSFAAERLPTFSGWSGGVAKRGEVSGSAMVKRAMSISCQLASRSTASGKPHWGKIAPAMRPECTMGPGKAGHALRASRVDD